MHITRRLSAAVVSVLTLLGVASSVWAQTTCVPFLSCPSNTGLAEMRQQYSSKTWFVGPQPSGLNDHIYLLDSDVRTEVDRAFAAYYTLDRAVPQDYTSTSSGDVTFGWGWVPASEIGNNPNRRTGVAAAAMALDQSNCSFTYSVAKFAYNPTDGVRLMCWTGDWCNPPWCTSPMCGDTTNLDYLSAAVHEYGHALGLDHSSTSGATMFSQLSAQDSSGRYLLACEANKVVAMYHDNNPAATVTSYTVSRSGGGIKVSWLAEQELSTDHYVIGRGDGPNGPFTSVLNVPISGTGAYSVTLPSATSGYYQLSEVETDGDVWPLHTEPDSDTESNPAYVQQSINFDSTLTAIYQEHPASRGAASPGPTQYYIFCPDSMKTDFQQLADAHTQYDNLRTEVVTYESIGGAANKKSYIAAHLPTGGHVLEAGDTWDGYDENGQQWAKNPALYTPQNGFTMPAWPDQPQNNLNRMMYLREYAHQSVSRNYFSPFGALPWYDVDFNNDGLPDVGYYLGYAPVSNRVEAQVFVAKSIQIMFRAPNPPANMSPPVAIMTYGRNYGSNSGARALQMRDHIIQQLHDVNLGLYLSSTTTSDANPLTTAQRTAALKARANAGVNAYILVSTVSQRYEGGAYGNVDLNCAGCYFDVNSLTANGIPAFVIGVTCEMGFGRTEDPAYGTPFWERMLFVPNRGVYGWFGNERGSFQGGNERGGMIFARRQFGTPSGEIPLRVGQIAAETVREMAAFKPDSLMAISNLLVGDPALRIMSPGPSVVSVNPDQPIDRALRLTPNPTLGASHLTFALAERAAVDLSIYDVAGRKVTTIVQSVLPAGLQSFSWNGHDRNGASVEAGIYFARLRVGRQQTQQALTLLR